MISMIEFPRENQLFMIPGPAGELEVMTTFPGNNFRGVGIVCHPDPRFAGSMQNKVVTTIARAFEHLKLATVRFNYRGVGRSTGEYGETVGELADLTAIIKWVRDVIPGQPLWLAGFSFGTYISALAAKKFSPARLLSVAPPVNHYDFNQFKGLSCPWLVIQGDEDEVVPTDQVRAWADQPPSPLNLVLMPGATHFFHGRLIELRGIIEKNL